jgi:hypothetical protein
MLFVLEVLGAEIVEVFQAILFAGGVGKEVFELLGLSEAF